MKGNYPSLNRRPQCDRCGKEMYAEIMSRFNTDIICSGCSERERSHPDYQKAVDAEIAEMRHGNYNFRGIGLPSDFATFDQPK